MRPQDPLALLLLLLLTHGAQSGDQEGAGSEDDSLYGDIDFENLESEDSYYRSDDMDAKFHMDDFAPSHVLTFPVAGGAEECFFEQLAKAPTKLRGAYFVSKGGSDIEVVVKRLGAREGGDTVLHSASSSADGIFFVVADRPSEYSFCFVNRHGTSQKTVTFALHVGVRKAEHAQRESLTPLETSVRSMHHALEDIVAQQNFLLLRTKMHMDTQDSTEWRVASYTMLESIFMVGVTLAQVYYVHSLINNRQWV